MWDQIGTIIAGALIGGYQNQRAAETAGRATIQGAEIAAGAIREGHEKAQTTLNQIRKEAAPATGYLRGVIADEGTLTPTQVTGLEEVRRGVTNQIRSSGFAGSGRTAAALFRKAEADYVNDALESNRGRSFDAARTMQSGATNAATGIANSQANAGTAIGKVYGDATTKAGLYDANAGLATGKLTGEALGAIGSVIANERRESRYADRARKIEQALGLG
jgi:hypothetical protein